MAYKPDQLKFIHCIALLCLVAGCKSPSEPANIPVKAVNATRPSDPSQYPFDVSLKDPFDKTYASFEILPKQDKPTVVLFWLTTCKPCARELAAIHQNFNSWQTQVPFHLVALSEDHINEYKTFVDRVKKEQWPFESYMDTERRFQDLLPGNLNGLPQTFIFDKQGNLTWKKRGFLPGDEAQYLEKIKEAAGS